MLAQPTPFGAYLLVEKLDGGEPGGPTREVFRALAGARDRSVIVKRLDNSLIDVEKFPARARALASVAHLNVVQLLDHGMVGGVPFVVADLVDGVDLATLLARAREAGRGLSPWLAAHVVAEAARGLFAAHQRARHGRPLGLLHRNIAPRNVLITVEGDVKLADFALWRTSPDAGWPAARLRYLAPEQLTGEPLDGRADIFALGVLLHEALTGQPIVAEPAGETALVRRGRLMEMLRAARHLPPSTIAIGLAADLDRVTLRALARDRGARTPSAEELRRELAQILRDQAPRGWDGRSELATLVSELAPRRREVERLEGEEDASSPSAEERAPEIGDRVARVHRPLTPRASVAVSVAARQSVVRTVEKRPGRWPAALGLGALGLALSVAVAAVALQENAPTPPAPLTRARELHVAPQPARGHADASSDPIALAAMAAPHDAQRWRDLIVGRDRARGWTTRCAAPEVCERREAVRHLIAIAPEDPDARRFARQLAASRVSESDGLRAQVSDARFDGGLLRLTMRLTNTSSAPIAIALTGARLDGARAPTVASPEQASLPAGSWREARLEFVVNELDASSAVVVLTPSLTLAALDETLDGAR